MLIVSYARAERFVFPFLSPVVVSPFCDGNCSLFTASWAINRTSVYVVVQLPEQKQREWLFVYCVVCPDYYGRISVKESSIVLTASHNDVVFYSKINNRNAVNLE